MIISTATVVSPATAIGDGRYCGECDPVGCVTNPSRVIITT
jgi:hypothetical protein